MTDAAWEAVQRCAVALALAMAAALPAIYVAFGVTAFADGSLFELSILSPSPWSLLWENYPSRISAFATTIVPPYLAGRLTGSADVALAVYRLLMGSLPLFSLLLTARLAGYRSPMTAACAVSTILSAYCVLFFPTELWLAHAAFWPLAALALKPGGARPVTLLAASLFTVFTHEAAVPVVALLLAAAAIRKRGLAIPFIAVATVSLAVAVKLWAPIPNSQISTSVHANALVFLTPNFLSNTMFDRAWIAAAAAAVVVLVLGFSRRRLALFLCVAIAAGGIMSMLVLPGDLHVLRRYLSRTLVFASLMLASCAMLAWSIAERWLPQLAARAGAQAAAFRRPAALVLGVAITVSAGGHVIETVRFLNAWAVLRTILSGPMTPSQTMPSGVTSLDLSGAFRNGLGPASASPAWEVAWNWGLPLQWAVAANGSEHRALPFHPAVPFTPIACAKLSAMAPGEVLLHSDRFTLLRRHVCQIEVERQADRLLP